MELEHVLVEELIFNELLENELQLFLRVCKTAAHTPLTSLSYSVLNQISFNFAHERAQSKLLLSNWRRWLSVHLNVWKFVVSHGFHQD